MQGTGTFHEKLVVAIERCRQRTLIHPSEPTTKKLVGMLVALTAPNADAAQLYGMVLATKAAFEAMRAHQPPSRMTSFPASPADLPHFLQHVYSTEAAVTMHVDSTCG